MKIINPLKTIIQLLMRHAPVGAMRQASSVCLLLAVSARAEVRLPALFSDHMVLQAGERVPVWGWADPEEKVSVELGGQKLRAQADAKGEWSVQFKPLKCGSDPASRTWD